MSLKPRQARKIILGIILVALLLMVIAGWKLGLWFGLKGDSEDRINVLLLGMGGEDHPGEKLTDSIIIISIQPSTGKTALISIPRDLWVSDPLYGETKLNAVYEHGISELKKKLTEITGLTIHYYAAIDFSGFTEIIDTLGGIEITVPRTYTDTLYDITFTKGLHHFDGESALIYARSRHATGEDGTDFARAARQQQILLATKAKLMSKESLLKPSSLAKNLSALNKSLRTDLAPAEFLKLWNYLKDKNDEDMIRIVFSTDNFLISKNNSQGSYILVPASGDYSETSTAARNIFTEQP